METKSPLPPFTEETVRQKVRLAEDAWNSRDPERVALVYTEDTQWRNRTEFPVGRDQVREFLRRKWARELVSLDQGTLGLLRESSGRAFCLRVA